MKQKYSELYIDSGVRRFYDYFEKDPHLPDGWSLRTDEWPDPHTSDRIYYLVFSNDVYDYEVHLAFKYNFAHAFVANVTPMHVDHLEVDEYNKCLNQFVEDIVVWYEDERLDQTFGYVYRKGKLVDDKADEKKAIFESVFEASASKVPAGKIVFSINDGEAGVSVDLSAMVSADIDVAKIIERFDPSNEESVFTTAKMYDSADIILDTSKTDAFSVVDSDKSAIDLLSEPGVINGFTFMGSTYVSGNCGIGYLSKAVVMGDRIELMLS